MAPRVLIIVENDSLPSDHHVWNQCRALSRAGYRVSVICPWGARRDTEPFERLEGVEIHRYRPAPAGGGALGYAREYAIALWQSARLALRLSRQGRFAVVHASSPPDVMLLAALPLRLCGARFVFDQHDLSPELYLTRFKPGPVHRATLLAERLAYRLADVVLSVNESYRLIAVERGRRRPEDVFVVRTGPDLTRLRRTDPGPALKRGRAHLLGYVGLMGSQDGIDHALRALAALQELRDDWRAIFMGDGEVLEEMRALAGELGLGDRVEFTGWVDHPTIARVLSTCDIGLAPDPHSPLNDVSSMVKISEYMALGLPIVSYDLRESRAAAGESAVYACGNDEADFAARIDELLDDPERRERMGALGRERAERWLAWEHQERSLLAAYERALGRAAPAAASPPDVSSSAAQTFVSQHD